MTAKKTLICIGQFRAVYAPIPKAANSSMKAVLARLLARDPATTHKPTHQAYWSESTQGQSTLVDTRYAAGLDPDEWFIFTIVRNPLDWLVSCYNNKVIENRSVNQRFMAMGVTPGMAFDEFVERACSVGDRRTEVHLRSQHHLLSYQDRLVTNYVAHYENIGDDYKIIQERLAKRSGKTVGRFPRKNVRRSRQNGRADYMDYFSDRELRELVVRRYRKDFEHFYPRELAELGPRGRIALLMPPRLVVLQRKLRRTVSSATSTN